MDREARNPSAQPRILSRKLQENSFLGEHFFFNFNVFHFTKMKSCSLCSENTTFRARQYSRCRVSAIAKAHFPIALTLQRKHCLALKVVLSLQSEQKIDRKSTKISQNEPQKHSEGGFGADLDRLRSKNQKNIKNIIF